ncbi:MAG: hypothetical protein V3R89_04780 [Thermoanaerobaculia bacterium]
MRSMALGRSLWLASAVAALATGCASADVAPAAGTRPELLGPLTREEIEVAVPSWVDAEIRATPDYDAAVGLVEALEGAEVTVLLGTWCSDSRRELARLWRAFDDAGLSDPPQLRYVGVDRGKREPEELVAGSVLLYVPTFIVRRGGEEVGRIVEESPGGIENDLLALLSGERRGLVTTKVELLQETSDGEGR